MELEAHKGTQRGEQQGVKRSWWRGQGRSCQNDPSGRPTPSWTGLYRAGAGLAPQQTVRSTIVSSVGILGKP